MAVQLHDDIFSPEVLDDPYSYYGLLREHDPVHWNAKIETWVITSHEDVVWVLRHPEIFSNESTQRDPRPPQPPIDEQDRPDYDFMRGFRDGELIRHDPPVHTRLRGIVNKELTPREVKAYLPLVQEVVADLLDAVESKGRMDLMASLAKPLPLLVIADLLGIPKTDRELIRSQAAKRMASDVTIYPDRMRMSAQGIRETMAYLEPHLAQRAKCPAGDFLTVFTEAEKNGACSHLEVLANAMSLIDAGHETTIKLISNGLLAFMRHPDQWELFKRDPEGLAESATEECLRYDPPLTAIRRIALRDVELKGRRIRKDDRVMYVIASANRDPAVFPDADKFDITRSPNRHVAFGNGIHYCLGQYLARMEGQEVFKAVARRLPGLRLVPDSLTWEPMRRNRAIDSVWIAWD